MLTQVVSIISATYHIMFNEGGHSFSTEKYYYTTENYFAISSAREMKRGKNSPKIYLTKRKDE